MNQLDNTAFKELNDMTLAIAERFFVVKQMRDISSKHLIKEQSLNEFNDFDRFLMKVQSAYDSLNDLEKNLINNEFFYQSYSQWWKPLYSKATFYRYKKEAMLKFLGAFYES